MIKEARWSGWVWVGECFFWYRPTRVVPDQTPLNGRCCCSVTHSLPTAQISRKSNHAFSHSAAEKQTDRQTGTNSEHITPAHSGGRTDEALPDPPWQLSYSLLFASQHWGAALGNPFHQSIDRSRQTDWFTATIDPMASDFCASTIMSSCLKPCLGSRNKRREGCKRPQATFTDKLAYEVTHLH